MKRFAINLRGGKVSTSDAEHMSVDSQGNLIFFNRDQNSLVDVYAAGTWTIGCEIKSLENSENPS